MHHKHSSLMYLLNHIHDNSRRDLVLFHQIEETCMEVILRVTVPGMDPGKVWIAAQVSKPSSTPYLSWVDQ